MTYNSAKHALKRYAGKRQAEILSSFFKTGSGEYGEGDIFIGVKVPFIRKVSKEFRELSLPEIGRLVRSPIHEERLLGLLILVLKFEKSVKKERTGYYRFYMAHAKYVNNWDLVDLTAPYLPGKYLLSGDKKVLYTMARSRDLWKRRIAMISTFAFIRAGRYADTLKIAEILLKDEHDLIHKAAGWMLREVGKRDRKAEESFLKRHYKEMPRTMLRYAIEKFPEPLRQKYLKGKV